MLGFPGPGVNATGPYLHRHKKKDRAGQAAELPRYRQLAEELIGEIRGGRLPVGQTLPGEFELCESYGVSRHTVREALRRLEELGLIARQRGVGTVVTASESSESYVQKVRSPAQLMQYPSESRLTVISSGEIVANRITARLLGCATGARWYRIRTIRQLRPGGAAIAWSDIYVLPEYADIVAAVGRKSTPVYELLEQRFDERVATVQVDLFAGLIAADRAELLGVAAGTPSLSVVRRYTGRNKRVFEVSVSEHPAGRYTYSLELHRGWSSGEGWAAG